MKYNRFLKEKLANARLRKPKATADKAADDDRFGRDSITDRQLGTRKKIAMGDDAPKAIVMTPENLTPHQKALREAVINRFKAKKVEKYISEQIEHINLKRQLADGIRFIFDERGNPPANAPLEDFVAVRKKIEADIRMLEAICSAMRSHLARIKEAEEMAFDLIGGQNKK